MREIINLLTESVGLANRKPGESFKNDKGDLMTFVGLNFYPSEGKFDDHRGLKDQIADIEQRTNTSIEFTNNTNAKMLAFGIVTFKDSNNKIVLYGRYFANINSIFTANFWPNSGLPNGFKYNKASATKMASGLLPQDILTNMVEQTPESILDQVVAKFGTTHPLTHLTNGISKGQPLPISIDISSYPDLSFEGFRDYFCEILQPIAVINGLTTGNANDAITTFFGKSGVKGATITFGSGKNVGLYDSLLISPAGRQIKISTKGQLGAQASVGNLIEAIDDLEISGNTILREKYSDIIEIIRTVKTKGYAEGPLALAEQFDLISGKDADIVRKLKTDSKVKLSKTLQPIYDDRASGADKTRLVPYYNMLAGIAYAVADYINENTNFSDAATDILNSSALIQIYTTAKNNGTEFVLNQFRSVYPSKLVAGVQFSPYKNYFSSGNKGNFTFKVLSSGVTPDVEPASSGPAASTVDDTEEKVDQIISGHSSIRPPGTVGRAKKSSNAVSAPRERK